MNTADGRLESASRAIPCLVNRMVCASETNSSAAGPPSVGCYCLHVAGDMIDTAVKTMRTADNFFHIQAKCLRITALTICSDGIWNGVRERAKLYLSIPVSVFEHELVGKISQLRVDRGWSAHHPNHSKKSRSGLFSSNARKNQTG
ncbi:hypothetical protein FAZ15_11545 [Sphingobacterium olei]|uniref:Uncharacterized protein n=1 Tax=Sphingobacterium olei TaxID=2571155 RepID=A0A4U0P0E4_9SPHI|nr:hypothetical protein [Sphingobacterium olei]TJZ60619.1 hypothetical protein FAZ15_11545 [Sphingobacterium olei]